MDVDDRLRRFRPIGAPPALRDRIVAASAEHDRERWLDWMLPAAAVAALVLFSVLARHERQQAAIDPSTEDQTRHALVDVMTDELRGDALLAKHVVSIEFVEDAPVE